MKLDELNYVDEAERVINKLKSRDRNGRLALTASKIRNLLSMIAELYTSAQQERGNTLSSEL